MAYLGNTLINGSLRCLNKAYFNDLSVGGAMEVTSLSTTGNASIGGTLAVTGTSTLTGATTIAGTLTLTKTTDLSALIIGTSTNKHLAIDNDEIQAMTNASSVNDLYINRDGGTVYIPNLNSNNGVITNLNASETTTNNLVVNNTLKSFKWDISNVANLANDFMIAPTIEISSTGKVTISLVDSEYRFTFADSSTITTDEFAGCKWYSGAKVRFTAQINDVLLSNVEGTLTSNMNTTSGAVTISTDLTSDDISGLDINTAYNASGSTIMLYEITQSGNESTTYPVGIHMTAYGTNNSYYIDMYGGNEPSSPTPVQPVFRIGNLGGVTYNGSTLDSQWGVYTYNGFFEGAVVSTEGSIGGFIIADGKLYTDGHPDYNTNAAGIYIGSDYIALGQKGRVRFRDTGIAYIGNWTLNGSNSRFYYGTIGNDKAINISTGTSSTTDIGGSGTDTHYWTITSGANFGVTREGTLYANDAHIQGDITANSLYLGDYKNKETNYFLFDGTNLSAKVDSLELSSGIDLDGIIDNITNQDNELNTVATQLSNIQTDLSQISLQVIKIANKDAFYNGDIINVYYTTPTGTVPTLHNYPAEPLFYIFDTCCDSNGTLYCSDNLICGTANYDTYLDTLATDGQGGYYIFEVNDGVYSWRELTLAEYQAASNQYASIDLGNNSVTISASMNSITTQLLIDSMGVKTSNNKLFCC